MEGGSVRGTAKQTERGERRGQIVREERDVVRLLIVRVFRDKGGRQPCLERSERHHLCLT